METHTAIAPGREANVPGDLLLSEPRWKMWGCMLLLLVGLHVAIGPKILLSKWELQRGFNTAYDEAIQWRHGTMALSDANPRWEAPMVDGKAYNAVGPAFVILSQVGLTLSQWLGAEPDTFIAPLYVLMVALPLPLVAFGVFRQLTKSAAWGAVLAAYLIAGTSLRPVLTLCGAGSIYHIDHVLAVTGLLLLAGDLLGRRRIWPAVIGLALAVWSRQMTCFYALPLLWIALRDAVQRPSQPDDAKPIPANAAAKTSRRPARLFIAMSGIALVAALPMTLSYLRFGNPLESGYPGMYHTRDDKVARDAKSCFWGPRWFGRHIWAMNLTIPTVDIRANSLQFVHTDQEGGSIWFTTPILLAVFITAKQWWRDPPRRALMFASLPVLIGMWGYHTTESQQCGYYRYALDIIPIWFAVIAPYLCSRKAVPWTLGCLAWSVLYFHIIVP